MTVSISSSYRIGLVAGTGVTISGPAVPAITTDDIFNPNNPSQTLTQMLAGISSAQLVGSAVVDGTAVGNTALFTVPVGQVMIPTNIIFAVTDLTGSGNAPAVNLGFTSTSYNDYINSVVNTTYDLSAGAFFASGTGYVPGDELTLSGGTHTVASQITLTDTLLVSTAINAAGSGYAPGDTITVTGGVAVTKAILGVSTTKLVTVNLNAAGTGYNIADTITLAGGTHSVAGVLTVSTCQLVSATIGGSGGTGYGNTTTFNATVAGGTGSPAAVINVTTNSGGVVTTINSITTPGSYTVLPTLTNNTPTGGTGSGLELNLVFGISTFTISTAGTYTVNSATFTQASTSGSGTGATFQGGLFGVNAVTINNGGDYTTNASSFTQFSSSGSGTGATFNTNEYGALAYTITTAGDYTVLPSNHVATTGGSGTGATFDAQWSLTTGLLTGLSAFGAMLSIYNIAADANNFTWQPAGTQLTCRVVFPATYSDYEVTAFVFGFLITAPVNS